MNTNTNIWTVIREYEYEYEYLSHTKPKINMLLYIKVRKVRKIMHICAIVCNLWHLVEFVQTYTNTNIFGMHVSDEYEYEYIRVDKKGRIQIQIYSG